MSLEFNSIAPTILLLLGMAFLLLPLEGQVAKICRLVTGALSLVLAVILIVRYCSASA